MFLWKDVITFGLAGVGAALGVVNTWTTVRSKRVRLRVTPQWSLASGWSGLSIEVINLGAFPVTVTEIGFTLDRSRSTLPKRVPIPTQAIVQGDVPPTTIQPHEATSLIFNADWLGSLPIQRAYARTASGEIARGTSGALEQFKSRRNRVF
jgi:hypothetical protein